jgi:site-specific DNA-methyltransferase (cytosine-N4-specific)
MEKLYNANCLDKLLEIEDGSIDAIFTDPPYPEIDREYGKMDAISWRDMMEKVVCNSRRVLKEDGSAVFVLQPNSEHIGTMRTWFWDFVSWAGREWNIIQDVWWFNQSTPPNAHCQRKHGLMRPSVKMCLWLGSPKCYRNQDAVLVPCSESTKAKFKNRKDGDNDLEYRPSGYSMRKDRCVSTAMERGGSTPFNLIKFGNVVSNGKFSAGKCGHGAGTPVGLTRWWLGYITKEDDLVLDMFSGVATTGMVCQELNRHYIGIEQFSKYHEIAKGRLNLL